MNKLIIIYFKKNIYINSKYNLMEEDNEKGNDNIETEQPEKVLNFSPRRRRLNSVQIRKQSFKNGTRKISDFQLEIKNSDKGGSINLNSENILPLPSSIASKAKQKKLNEIFKTKKYQIFIIIITSYILIADDIKFLFTKKSSDIIFSIICIIITIIYLIELIFRLILNKKYVFIVYFWLDIISILSCLFEIHWFYNWIFRKVGESTDLGKRNEKKILRAVKLIKLLRIFRIFRIAKICRAIIKIKIYQDKENQMKLTKEKEDKEKKIQEEEDKKRKEQEEEAKKNAKVVLEAYNKKLVEKKKQKENKNTLKKLVQKTLVNYQDNTHHNPKKVIKRNSLFVGGVNGVPLPFAEITPPIEKKQPNEQDHKINESDSESGSLSESESENSKSKGSKEVSIVENKDQFEINLNNTPINENMVNKGKLIKKLTLNKNSAYNLKVNNSLNKSRTFVKDTKIPKVNPVNKEQDDQGKMKRLLLGKSSRNFILFMLIEVFCFTIFNVSFFISRKTSMESSLKYFNNFNSTNNLKLQSFFSTYIEHHTHNIKTPIIYCQISNLEYGDYDKVNNLREQEKIIYSEKCSKFNNNSNNNINYCNVVIDYRYFNKINALMNLIKTIIISIIIILCMNWFQTDLCLMVLDPADAMIERVKLISNNPLQVIQEEEKNELEKAIKAGKTLKEEESNNNCCCFKNKNEEPIKESNLETELLEKTISKITALLALSLGDAGTEIISKNINVTGKLNPMSSGKKICAIYAFCDVRNFTGVTEVLQEKVMVFVNDIAEIVHQIAFEYGGSANKNIGDAFLLVWKFNKKFTYFAKKSKELKVYNCEQVNQICDMALISIIKIFAEVKKSKELEKFQNNQQLIKKFGKNCIKIGFGIHLGWSIEGAIGSNFKIDASYLSPNANMANLCEEKTKIYGGNIIMSDKFVENLSDETQKILRIVDIDREGEEPIGYYTIDFDIEGLFVDKGKKEFDKNEKDITSIKKIKRFQRRIARKKNMEYATSIPPKKYFWKDFNENNPDWKDMRLNFEDEDFYKYYNEGFDEFQFGDWNKAKKLLTKTLELKDDDVPSLRMMKIMKSYNYKKPNDWKGSTKA